MPCIQYEDRRFSATSERLIAIARDILEEYRAQDFSLTVRQLYYQFVARGHIPNTMREYKKLADLIKNARMAGRIDWEDIIDRTRNLKSLPSWESGADVLQAAAESFHMDRWRDQDYRPEVWIEKDALVGVIEAVCNELDVPFFACRGYSSVSEQWAAAVRFVKTIKAGQIPIVFHLGDHDPSGLDMTRDNRERLRILTGGRDVTVRRLALNMDQIEQYNPPPNPAKLSDSRAGGYVSEFGYESWELDALEPSVISRVIRSAVEDLIDWDAWNAVLDEEAGIVSRLEDTADEWAAGR